MDTLKHLVFNVAYINRYTTDKTLKLRVVCDILQKLEMDLKSLEQHLGGQYIHPQVATELQNILDEHFPTLVQEETELVNNVLSTDYPDFENVAKLADILTEKITACDKTVEFKLNYLFAVDGFSPKLNYKHYTEFLSVPLREDAHYTRGPALTAQAHHAFALREVYKRHQEEMNLNPFDMQKMLMDVYEEVATSKPSDLQNKLTESYGQSFKNMIPDSYYYMRMVGQDLIYDVVKLIDTRNEMEFEEAMKDSTV